MNDQGTRSPRHLLLARTAQVIGALLLLVSCGPSTSGSTTPSEGVAAVPESGPKTITMAMQSEPTSIVLYGRPSSSVTASYERYFIFHDNLTVFDFQGNPAARAAQKVPSVQDGDWKLFPDGSMEVTWKLRPDVFWHDGTPLVADDFVFGYQLVTTPALAVLSLGEVLNVSSVQAPDDHTLVISWKSPSIWGNTNGTEGIPALPRHLLRDTFLAGDYPAIDNSPLWTTDWVGLGPYRLTQWAQGSHVEAQAYDRFYLGRPKIDRITINWIADVNVMVANILAGTVDVAPLGSMLKPEQIAELRRIWSDRGQAYTAPNAVRNVYLQFRDPSAPWVQDVRFRQAMILSLNRDSYVEALQYGLTPRADLYLMPEDPVYALAEQRGVARYPYDPARAERLFADAGWTRGPDRMLRNSAGEGVSFLCCRFPDADSNDTRESLALVGDLQAAGIQAIYPLPSTPAGLSAVEIRKFQTLNRQGYVSPFRFGMREGFAILTSAQVQTEQNRWQGSNVGGWSNPAYDALYARTMSTFDRTERQELMVQMARMIAEEVPVIPLYYNPLGVTVRNGVEGIHASPHAPILSLATSWNVETWDLVR